MKVLLLSRYGSLGASSRVRYLQYLSYFRSQGVEVSVVPLFSDAYLTAFYQGGSRWREVLKGYLRRFRALIQARQFNVLIVEKELFPFLPALAERLLRLLKLPYLVDYDDALFHRYDCHPRFLIRHLLGRKIDTVMRNSSAVIAGNEYLAERARQAGASRVEIIPTVVDSGHYKPAAQRTTTTPVVGWIGTPKTSRYLQALLPVFESLQQEMEVHFVAVGARAEDFAGSPVTVWSWSEETEVDSIQHFDIGIMPLVDSPWERGKCGYKLIQYMACGIPVVASPVGVNREIVVPEENGLLADTLEQWQAALRRLLHEDPSVRRTMGCAGRARVEESYSLKAQAPKLFATITEAIK